MTGVRLDTSLYRGCQQTALVCTTLGNVFKIGRHLYVCALIDDLTEAIERMKNFSFVFIYIPFLGPLQIVWFSSTLSFIHESKRLLFLGMAETISFTHAVTFVNMFSTLGALRVLSSTTPSFITEDKKPNDLECYFSGWPLPLEVHWYKDGKIITNGTEGIYHSEDKQWNNGQKTLRSKLSLPPGREELEGIYKCRAKNSISGWQSEVFEELQLIYMCK